MASSVGLKQILTKELLYDLHTKRGLSLREIARKYHVSYPTIRYWCLKCDVPIENQRVAASKHNLRNVDLSPSPELSYIIGVILGDGNLYITKDRTFWIRLKAKDKEFVMEFNRAICGVLKRKELYPVHIFRSKYYRVVAYSKNLFGFLKDRDKFRSTINKFPREFIRGLYESEGNFSERPDQIKVSICSSERKTLGLAEEAITYLGFKSVIYGPRYDKRRADSKPMFSTYILGGREEVKRFLEVINPVIKGGKIERSCDRGSWFYRFTLV